MYPPHQHGHTPIYPRQRIQARTILSLLAGLTTLTLVATVQSPGPLLATAQGALKTLSSTAGNALGRVLQTSPAPASEVDAKTIKASTVAITDIPSEYLALYVATDQDMTKLCPELTWQLLAGIGKVESDHGRSSAPGVRSGVNRFGCCAGPMQFNVRNGPPSTWDGYRRSGDSVYDPADAIPAAGRKLCNDGLGPSARAQTWSGRRGGDPCQQVRGSAAQHRALRRYNNVCSYVATVLAYVARYTSGQPDSATAGQDDSFARNLSANPRITTTSSHGCDPRSDIASGRLDLRVQALIAALAERWTFRISCVRTGHSKYVKGTQRVSNHTVWRAIDIDIVNDRGVATANRDAHALVAWIDRLSGPLRPSEVGSPFKDFAGQPMYFTDEGHLGHVHIGYSSDPTG